MKTRLSFSHPTVSLSPSSGMRGLVWLLAGLVSCAVGASAQKLPQPLRLTSGWELQDSAKISQTGDLISRADYQPAQWYRATVPGTVLTSLVNDGVYPEPLVWRK